MVLVCWAPWGPLARGNLGQVFTEAASTQLDFVAFSLIFYKMSTFQRAVWFIRSPASRGTHGSFDVFFPKRGEQI